MVGPTADPVCRGCGKLLTPENDSEAHVIPNALGGRLKPKGIVCRECNTRLDDIADNALVRAFGDWPTLLDIPRDRGPNPPRLIETRNGRRVRLEADGSMTAVDIKYSVVPAEDGHTIQIAAGDMKTFRQLLKRVEKQFPQFDARSAELHAERLGLEDDDELRVGLDFSPIAVFGGVVTILWIYLILTTGRAFMDWGRLLNVIEGMKTNGGTFRYLTHGVPGLKGPDVPIGHKILTRSIPSTGQLIAYVEILGILKVGGVFAEAGGPTELLESIYAYDVIANANRSAEFSIDSSEFEAQDWKSIGLGPSDAEELRAHFRLALETVFVRRYRERFAEGSTDPSSS